MIRTFIFSAHQDFSNFPRHARKPTPSTTLHGTRKTKPLEPPHVTSSKSTLHVVFMITLLCVMWYACANGQTWGFFFFFFCTKKPWCSSHQTLTPSMFERRPGKCAAGWERTAAVVTLDSQQSVGRLPAAAKHRAREQDREKKWILNAHKNFENLFARTDSFC